MKSNKAQVGIELIVIIGALLFFLVAFLGVIGNNVLEKNKERQDLMVKLLAMDVQDEIELAKQSTDGYYREFNVPARIENKEYNISLVENQVYIITNDRKNSIALPIENITGIINEGNNIIRKINGSLYINT